MYYVPYIRGKDGAVVARFPCFPGGVIFIGGLEYDLRVLLHVWQTLVVYLRLNCFIFRPEIALAFRGKDNITVITSHSSLSVL